MIFLRHLAKLISDVELDTRKGFGADSSAYAKMASTWSDEDEKPKVSVSEKNHKPSSRSIRLRELIARQRTKKDMTNAFRHGQNSTKDAAQVYDNAEDKFEAESEWNEDVITDSEDEEKRNCEKNVTPVVAFDTMKGVRNLDWIYTRKTMEEIENCDFYPRLICAALNCNLALRLWIGLENCKNEIVASSKWAPLETVEVNFAPLFSKLYISGQIAPKLPEGVICIQNVFQGSPEFQEFFSHVLPKRPSQSVQQFCLLAKVSVLPNNESNVTLYKFNRQLFFLNEEKKHIVFFQGSNIAEIGHYIANKSVNYHLDMLSGARWARERSKNSFL